MKTVILALTFTFMNIAVALGGNPVVHNQAPSIEGHYASVKKDLDGIFQWYATEVQNGITDPAQIGELNGQLGQKTSQVYDDFVTKRTREYEAEYKLLVKEVRKRAGKCQIFGARSWKSSSATISENGLHWQFDPKYTKTVTVHSHGKVSKSLKQLPNGLHVTVSAREARWNNPHRGSSNLVIRVECKFNRSGVFAVEQAHNDLEQIKARWEKSMN